MYEDLNKICIYNVGMMNNRWDNLPHAEAGDGGKGNIWLISSVRVTYGSLAYLSVWKKALSLTYMMSRALVGVRRWLLILQLGLDWWHRGSCHAASRIPITCLAERLGWLSL